MYKILIVDDNPTFCTTLSGLLSDEGYSVKTATNEGEALDAVIQESFDFALIDVRLHDGGEEDESGSSLAMAFRALDPQIRVILLTRYARTKQIVRAIRYLGVTDFIEKTQDVGNQVLDAISSAHESGEKVVKRPNYEKASESRLSLLLSTDRPLTVRARGRHVCSACTSKILEVNMDRYVEKTQIARQNPDHLRFHIKEIGYDLWHDIFAEHPEIERAYVEARAKSQPLTLFFETSRDFLKLPLEFIRSDEPDEHLVLQHPMARFICGITPRQEAISPHLMARAEKLRVLMVASNTHPPIDGVDSEAQTLSHYLKRQEFMPVDVDLLPTEKATYDRFRNAIKNGKYDILHYAGHGLHTPNSPEKSCLYFWEGEDKQGNIIEMQATELKMLLEHSTIRLVYLSSCYGTTSGDERDLLHDDFLGLADAVVQAGTPSVIGFRWPVSDSGAHDLAQSFYCSLLEMGSPEIALWSARRGLAIDRDNPTWLSPILIHQM
jgi:ActR/RegA family two-component response regulator